MCSCVLLKSPCSRRDRVGFFWGVGGGGGRCSFVCLFVNTYSPHCRQLRLSKKLVIFGYNFDTHADNISDFFILLAKYHLFNANTNNARPLIQASVRAVDSGASKVQKSGVYCKMERRHEVFAHMYYDPI